MYQENVGIIGELNLREIEPKTVSSEQKTSLYLDEEELKIVISEITILNFFENDVVLSKAQFKKPLDFSGTSFLDKVDFNGANINEHIKFEFATINDSANFYNTTFDDTASSILRSLIGGPISNMQTLVVQLDSIMQLLKIGPYSVIM